MGWFSNLTSKVFGSSSAGKASDLINSPFGGLEDYVTGASSANRQYRYESALQSASQGFSAAEAEKAHQRSIELAKLEDSLSRGYFDYVANYNTPANQMARLQDAGLNPNLVYGNGAMAVQASTPIEHIPTSAQASGSGVGSAIGGYSQSLGSMIGAVSGLTGMARDLQAARESKARTELLAAQKTGQDLENVFEKSYGMLGKGKLGSAARTVLGLRAMFPEQFDMARKWIVDKFKGANVSPGSVRKTFLDTFKKSSNITSPTIINQHFGNVGAGNGYIPDLRR